MGLAKCCYLMLQNNLVTPILFQCTFWNRQLGDYIRPNEKQVLWFASFYTFYFLFSFFLFCFRQKVPIVGHFCGRELINSHGKYVSNRTGIGFVLLPDYMTKMVLGMDHLIQRN